MSGHCNCECIRGGLKTPHSTLTSSLSDFAQTPVGKIRDLVIDEDVFIFAIIGPDVPGADIALLTFIWSARPGYDRRVRFVSCLARVGMPTPFDCCSQSYRPERMSPATVDPTPRRLEEDLDSVALGRGV